MRHHAVYRQRIREVGGDVQDARNCVVVCGSCHAYHHAQSRPLPLAALGDLVFEFASELLGPGAAYNYLRRRYVGEDPRLDALLG